MGYQMNVSDAAVTKIGDGFELTNLGINGYENKFRTVHDHRRLQGSDGRLDV